VNAALAELALERLLVVVVGDAPHKTVVTGAETRFRLAEAAFAGVPRVELSRQELERAGPSYTVETARWAEREFGDAVFIVGADEFADFLGWKDPNGVLEHIHLAVATRPGFPREELEGVLEGLERPRRVLFFDLEPIHVASRDVRARAAQGEPIDELVPLRVARLIEDLALYRD
jgi:nicotinate-nucleotide adenylyltransferase